MGHDSRTYENRWWCHSTTRRPHKSGTVFSPKLLPPPIPLSLVCATRKYVCGGERRAGERAGEREGKRNRAHAREREKNNERVRVCECVRNKTASGCCARRNERLSQSLPLESTGDGHHSFLFSCSYSDIPLYTHTYTYTYTYTRKHTHTYIHAHIHAHIHTHVHTHTHTHIHPPTHAASSPGMSEVVSQVKNLKSQIAAQFVT